MEKPMILKSGNSGGAAALHFFVDRNAPTPIVQQIEDQIKLAVMMGVLRSGDTLPSIRDIEKQTGINRNQIHRAYQALRRSGLLVLTRGKGSVVTTDVVSPRSVSDKCHRLSKEFFEKVRRSGISPTAFARFFSQYAQQSERKEPLIAHVDHDEDRAVQTAGEISHLWGVPVKPIALRRLKAEIRKGKAPQKLLVNHVMCDAVRSLIPDGASVSIIPVEISYSPQAVDKLSRIAANSRLLYIILPQDSSRVRFMISQMQKLIQAPGIQISSLSIDKIPSFEKLLRRAEYDHFLVGPGVIGDIPPKLRSDPRVILLEAQISAASLEAARIRTGVVV